MTGYMTCFSKTLRFKPLDMGGGESPLVAIANIKRKKPVRRIELQSHAS